MSVERRAPDPPGPEGIPWFGSLGEVRADPMDFYADLAERYGGIVRFFYGRKPTYLVSDPGLIKEMLVDNKASYVKNRRYRALRLFIGEGLLHAEGETWKRQRRLTNPGFHPRIIASKVDRAVELIDEKLDLWESHADSGEAHDVEPDFSRLSQTLIGDWVLGPSRRDAVDRVIDVQRRTQAAWPPPPRTILAGFKPASPIRAWKLRGLLAELDDTFYGAIRDHRSRPRDDDSLLAVLAESEWGEGKLRFTDRELRDQLITLYMAGFETSEALMTFLWYRLSMQPEIRQRLVDEVDRVLGGEPPRQEDLAELDYVKRSIQEALRIYPPAYNFSRVPLEDQTLGGYHVPAGRMVIVSPYAVHRLTEHWRNPEGFDPDRFLPERAAGRPGFAYIPFGAGHRACIGANLAMVQATLIATRVAQRYRLDVVPGHPVERAPGTVMRPRYGMRMLISRRSPAAARSEPEPVAAQA